MLFSGLPIEAMVSLISALIIGLSFHEFSHAWTANYFGDDTPSSQGRLTLNPLRHLDPIGTLMMLLVGFGWAKPVQVNTYNLSRHSYWATMWVSLAGPLSNLLLALIGGFILMFQFIIVFPLSLIIFFRYFIFFNLALMFFNLMPFFPLDGEKVLFYLLPIEGQNFLLKLRKYSYLPMFVILFVLPRMGIQMTEYLVWRPAEILMNMIT